MSSYARTSTRPAPEVPGRSLALVAFSAALMAGMSGLVLVTLMLAARQPPVVIVPPGGAAEAGGLSLKLDEPQRPSLDEHSPDAQMPASMMPGMPAHGYYRLHLQLTLENPGDSPRRFSPHEFHLRSADGISLPPTGSTFLAGALGPGQALNGMLLFDALESESSLHLVWTRGGRETHLPLADPPGHSEHQSEGGASP